MSHTLQKLQNCYDINHARFESLYVHDYTQSRAISEGSFYWIKLSFCIASEQQKVCSVIFLVFGKY